MFAAISPSLAWSVPAFALGALAAFIDIDSFFRSKRISYTISGNVRCYFFLALNGALSAGLLIWAIQSDANSLINKIIQVEPAEAKMVVIALGVPLVLRSKLFSFGENQTPAGPAVAYDWARLKVLYNVNMQSAIVKDGLSVAYAVRHSGKATFPNTVKDLVDSYVNPFATDAEKAQLQKEFDAIQAAFAGPAALTADHCQKLIRWAMDSTSIGYVKDRLAA